MELLLTYEASCNAADEKGSSPLHLAAWAGFAPIVDALLTHGPSVANANLTVTARLLSRNLGSYKSGFASDILGYILVTGWISINAHLN